MERKPVLVDLALQGGGSHGAFTWGVLDRLLEEPWLKIDGISGTSIADIARSFEMKEAANRGDLANLKAITPSIRRQFDRPSTAKIGECCVLMALSDRLVLSWPACAPYRPHDPNQQDRADKPGDQVADPSP